MQAGSFPTAFGKYVLLKPLAHGGMGDIYLALGGEMGGFEKLCVIKRVRARRENESAVRRFLDEAKVVVKLSHGNLVQVFDAGCVGDEVYLAMEYVEGSDLRDLMVKCDETKLRVPTEVALYVALQVCRGLDYAHGFGDLKLVHRDICPSNVLVSYTGEVKLTDFGLASSRLKEEQTAPGKVFGRFAYLAPEQAHRGEIDLRTDLYATSIILWELLTGHQMRPGPHTDPGLALSQVRSGKITPPSARNPRIPPELDAIVIKGLQQEQNRRYGSAEELRRALAKVLARQAPTFDAAGVHDFMRQVYGEKIDEARSERERLLGQSYDRFRRASSTSFAGGSPSLPGSPSLQGSISGRRPGVPENLAGQVVDGRYQIIRMIGEGGMGAVYEAEHVEIGRRVAIKILHAIFSSHPETVARFRAEARAATRIGHPNIVEVTDSGTTGDGRVYFVMELLSGVDLARVMAEDRIVPAPRAMGITLQICRALHAAHEAGIVHRDLKPENIFLTQRDTQVDFVKILDFGIAKNVELGGADDRLTHPGIAMGTPEYMAPEQAAGKDVDRRIDVYATGALLYEMLTGHLPHEGDNLMQVLSMKASHPPPPPRTFRPDMPPELEQVILKSLAADRALRFQTMEALAEALQPFAGEGGSAWDATKESPLPPPLRGRAAPPGAPQGPRTGPVRAGPDGGTVVPDRSSPARRVASGQVRISDDVMSSAHARISLSPASPTAATPHAVPAPAMAETAPLPTQPPPVATPPAPPGKLGLAPTLMVPALRRRFLWLVVGGGGLILLLAVALTIALWPRAPKPLVKPAHPDAAVRRPRPDARAPTPATRPATRPKVKLTAEEIDRLLEWAKLAAEGGRYIRPKGDNVLELLDRIEEDHPEHPATQALRRDLSKRVKKQAQTAIRKSQFAAAERLLRSWMALDPLAKQAREVMAQVQLAQGRQALAHNRPKVAATYAAEAKNYAPESPAIEELYGDIAMKRRKYSTAVEHYEKALAASPPKAQKRINTKLKAARKKVR